MRSALLVLLCATGCATADATSHGIRAVTGKFYIIGEIVPALVPHVKEFLDDTTYPEIMLATPGGYRDASVEIADAIAAHGNVRCTVLDRADSGGFAILQACRIRIMRMSAKIATHEPRLVIAIPIERSFAGIILKSLEKSSAEWNARCRARLKISAQEYDSRVRGRDWSMAAHEALLVGAVDQVIP